MRFCSNDKADSGWPAWNDVIKAGKRILVTLDGVEQNMVSMADDEQGEICRCILDDEGHAQVDPDHPDLIWVEKVRGDVRIIIE